MSRRVIEAQESERRHLALELHDEIGQILTTVNLGLESLRSRIDPAYEYRLEDGVRIVNQAIEQVRDLSLNLRPASLDILGLEAALRAYAKRQCSRAGFVAEVASSLGEQRLSPMLETVCFRIAQEALTNVIRHANAAHCWIELACQGGDVFVSIRDDGIGFDPAEIRERGHRGESFGLLGMQERSHLFNGRFEVESSPGAGTVVRARFPLLPFESMERISR
jgi:signal transduction histidine kinase